jgi:hypothetical protein
MTRRGGDLRLWMAAAVFCLTGTPTVPAADRGFPFNPIPARVELPATNAVVADSAADTPLDLLVLDRLREAGLTMAPEVDRRTYLRRLSSDLRGLPPTPEEMRLFLGDPRSDAEARVAIVEQFLASTHYGERLGRLWLDVARYADTDGFAIDGERPTLWRYRDYVVRTFNTDRPFDLFVKEQLAGDLLERGAEGLVATGFYRLGPWEADNMTPEHRRQDFLNEMTSAIGSVLLGLTLGCARCHDHKFDPVPTADYYRLQAFLGAEDRGDRPCELLPQELTGPVERGREAAEAERNAAQRVLDDLLAQVKQKLSRPLGISAAEITEQQILEAIEKKVEAITPEEVKQLEAAKKRVKENFGLRFQPQAVSLSRLPADKVTPTKILRNGDPFDPADEVPTGFLSSVTPWDSPLFERTDLERWPAERQRLRLAEWIASPHNPLTARVFVNRIWQHLLGQGLVATANDFGVAGAGVSNERLLNFVARDFIDHGWSVKHLVRQVVLSRAYRAGTVHPQAEQAARVDPANHLLWRGAFRRLDAEGVRDALLLVSDRLNREAGGPGFFEQLPAGVELKYDFFDWPVSSLEERRRRSVYMFQRRNLVHPAMEVFDVADANLPCERRRPSITAPQVLLLLNGDLAHNAARALADRLRSECGTDQAAQVERLYERVLNRLPDEIERPLCLQFLTNPAPSLAAEVSAETPVATTAGGNENENASPKSVPASEPLDALGRLCLVLLNSSEFLYLD